MEEREAVARLKCGDIGGLEYLVRRYYVPAVRSAYLVAHDRALAEDIVQAAFLRAYERIGQFDEARPFGPWFLRGVVRDAAKAAARRQRRAGFDGEAGDGTPADPAPGPDRLLEQAETREEVWAALQRLPPAQREAVVLRYYLDLKEGDIATMIAAPLGTVKWRLHAARQRLLALLGSR